MKNWGTTEKSEERIFSKHSKSQRSDLFLENEEEEEAEKLNRHSSNNTNNNFERRKRR